MNQYRELEDSRNPKEIVVSGHSEVAKICIESPDLASTATYDEKTDAVTVEVDLRENARSDSLKKDKKFYIRFALYVISLYASFFGLSASVVMNNPILANGLAYISIVIFALLVYFAAKDSITIARSFGRIGKVAPWHGAEHKVIEAYQQTGTTDLELARATSPISDQCGGRIAVLLLAGLIPIFTLWIAIDLDDRTAFNVALCSTVAVFMLGMIFPRKTMKIAVRLSRRLQRHLTVKEPGEKELWTAHCAITELVKSETGWKDLAGFKKYSVTYNRRT